MHKVILKGVCIPDAISEYKKERREEQRRQEEFIEMKNLIKLRRSRDV